MANSKNGKKASEKASVQDILDNESQNQSVTVAKVFEEKRNKFQSKFSFDKNLNRPIFKIFSDYFNILNEKEELQKAHGIKVLGMLRDEEFKENINLFDSYGKKNVLLSYDGLVINLLFDVYKQHNEVHFYFYMASNEKSFVDAESFYKKLWSHAVDVSDLKGSYFVMERDEILWQKKKLEKRTFKDIYLPSSTIEDLKLYVATNAQANKLMRYLMVGNPGTGKTESTLVLSNELNRAGVTIIKTPVCAMIKEKVELASLLAPSLIIFDDIDLSLGSRKTGAYSERLQDFLDVLDGTDKISEQVGMIATTNSVALLDMAAQRPGRFDKVLSFDELTSDNVKNIILKSLKYNYNILPTDLVAKIFSDKKIVTLFRDSKVTGAHIFSSVKMLKLRMDLLKISVELETVFDELKKEIKTIDKIRQADYLSDKLNGGRKGIGFGSSEEEEEEGKEENSDEKYIEHPSEEEKEDRSSRRNT